MDLENFVKKFLKDLPAATILGITVLENKYTALLGNLLRPSSIKDASTQRWLMVSRFNPKREPLVVLLPVNPISVGISLYMQLLMRIVDNYILTLFVFNTFRKFRRRLS